MSKSAACILSVTVSWYASSLSIVRAESPSFDCSRARYADEFAICSIPELARLDNVATRGYLYVEEGQGRIAADAIGVPFWKARHACGSDPECIRQRQLQAIAAYQADGAPASVPESPAAEPPSSPTFLKMTLGPYNPGYIVDGVTLGSVVNTDSTGYKSLN